MNGENDVDVATEALRSDAVIWDQAADDLYAPKIALGFLTLTRADVSMWGGDAGIDRTYDDGRTRLEEIIEQAILSFRALALSLRNAANLYEQDEADHLQQLNRAEGN